MKDALKDTLYFCRNHQKGIVALLIPYFFLMFFVSVFVQLFAENSRALAGVGHLILLAIQPLYIGRLIKYVDNVVNKSGRVLSVSFQEWQRLLLTNILAGLAIALGFLAFIIPGIYISLRLGFAEFVTLLEEKSPVESIKNSWVDSQPYVWQLLGGGLLFGGGGILLSFAMAAGTGESLVSMLLTEGVGLIISLLLTVLLTVFIFRVYDGMRSDRHVSL